jgi:hypothetical protein
MKTARMACGGSPDGAGRAVVRILDFVRNYFSGTAA